MSTFRTHADIEIDVPGLLDDENVLERVERDLVLPSQASSENLLNSEKFTGSTQHSGNFRGLDEKLSSLDDQLPSLSERLPSLGTQSAGVGLLGTLGASDSSQQS